MSSNNEQVQNYFAALRESYDSFAGAVSSASARGTAISDQLVREAEAAQREGLALGEKIAADPSNSAEHYTAVLEVTLAAQDRALAFARDIYSQSTDVGSDSRDVLDKLLASSREVSEATVALSRNWQQDGSWAEAWQKGFETMTSAAEQAAPKATSKAAASKS